jgi:hypothetical protein
LLDDFSQSLARFDSVPCSTVQKRQKKPRWTYPAKFESCATPGTVLSLPGSIEHSACKVSPHRVWGEAHTGKLFFLQQAWHRMGKHDFCYIGDMIVIRCYKYTVCGSCYLSTHSFKVRWECLAKKPKAICFHCFKDKSVNNCKQQKLQSLFILFKSITHLLKTSGSIS